MAAMDAVKRSIETAVALVQRWEARAVVTNPVSKAHLYEAGFAFPGHTEYLAALAGDGGETPLLPVMMLVAGPFKVVPTSPRTCCARPSRSPTGTCAASSATSNRGLP
jgi:4-hydroxythreonine-4-phosphate dehydrogenase